jgi:hypothetical protein
MIIDGLNLGAASTEGTRRPQAWGGGPDTRVTNSAAIRLAGKLEGNAMADGNIETLMNARTQLEKKRLTWAQTIATPGEIPERAISGQQRS